jgi:hypothetical protein
MSNIFIGGISGVAKKQPQYIYNVYEVGDIDEKSGLAEYQKIKVVKVRRAEERSAKDYVHGLYNYRKTGKNYFIELKDVIYS